MSGKPTYRPIGVTFRIARHSGTIPGRFDERYDSVVIFHGKALWYILVAVREIEMEFLDRNSNARKGEFASGEDIWGPRRVARS